MKNPLLFGAVGALLVISCGDPEDHGSLSGEVGYVLSDLDAREAGLVLTVDDVGVSALAPEMVDPASRVFVGAGDGVHLGVRAGELLHLTGPDARVERLVLGRDVNPDRVLVRADADAAERLAEQLGASVEPDADGRFVLEAPDVLERLASADMPEGVTDVRPALFAPAAAPVTAPIAAPALAAEHAALRIAPAMLAPDPAREVGVVGRWEADDTMENQGTRYRMVLEVEPVEGDPTRVRGRIFSHFTVEPRFGCMGVNPDAAHLIAPTQISVEMQATGTFDGERFSFGATSWRNVGAPMPSFMGYNPDHFTGTLDGDTLRTVNNDGGMAVDHPVDFVRVL